jgi:hypothetical protein
VLTIFLLFGTCLVLILSLRSQPARKFDKESLAGLTGVGLIIEPLPELNDSDSLSEAELREEIERRLLGAGINILSKDELRQAPGYPLLDISLQAHQIPRQDAVCTFSIAVELQQIVTLQRSEPAEAFATTWNSRSMGSVASDCLDSLRSNVLDHVDRFVHDWLSVNQKQG